ncbi:MAG: hypothetical protein IRY97_03955, partial [Thermomicrobiaceae bacterium]|nr:hypothetical protein [Thermomicrobiaceae bacterium]
MRRNLVILGLLAVLVLGFALAYLLLTPPREQGMEAPILTGGPTIPQVRAYAEGKEVRFIHTEASDPAVAGMLTRMMGGSQVLVVPALAQVPDAALADVYVFTNGILGEGPLGYQPDVVDRPPGAPGY